MVKFLIKRKTLLSYVLINWKPFPPLDQSNGHGKLFGSLNYVLVILNNPQYSKTDFEICSFYKSFSLKYSRLLNKKLKIIDITVVQHCSRACEERASKRVTSPFRPLELTSFTINRCITLPPPLQFIVKFNICSFFTFQFHMGTITVTHLFTL